MTTGQLLLFLSLCGIYYTTCEYCDNSWNWLWICNFKEGKCVRSAQPAAVLDPTIASGSVHYNSLDVCRLTCGKYGALWPKPTISTLLEHQLITVHPDSFHFEIRNNDDSILQFFQENAFLFQENLLKECKGNCSVRTDTVVTVYILVQSPHLTLNWNTNESYSLEIITKGNSVSVEISSETAYGARHALETLTQLIASYSVYDKETRGKQWALVMVARAKIRDKPVYPHRGLLLDTARNFLPTKAIQRQINAMAASKLNVLHWHITDSQSFPLQSRRVPLLSRFGAYSPQQVYTPQKVESLIKYAQTRGIRIVMEIDAPSHAGNGWQWGKDAGLGDLAVCVNQQPWRSYCIQPPCGQLNPANKHVYSVLSDLYADILDMLPRNEIFHMGGDEVFIQCWNSSVEIIEYLRKQGKGQTIEDFLDLWAEFQEIALQKFDNRVGHNRTPIILWSSLLTQPEIIQKYLDPNRYVIQTWVAGANELPERLLQLGYYLIISTKDAWYLDHGFWGSTKYHTWRTAYNNQLPKGDKVLGGEACMWGELVDENSLDSKVWPRSAAVAERLWSDPPPDTASAEVRFYRHRERLVTRGIHAEAVTPRWCLQNEGECNNDR